MGGLGSDGSGGSTNGESSLAGCKIIVEALKLNSSDVLMDVGSSGGLTLAWLNALSGCRASIGIEVELLRYQVAEAFNLRLMNSQPQFDSRIVFYNADITNFSRLSGVTKLFMYDKVFNPDTMFSIGETVNRTESIQYIVSTKNLVSFNFNVRLVCNMGCLSARGGKMSHTFYLYEHENYEPNSDAWKITRHMKGLIELASDKEQRLKRLEKHVGAVLNRERLTRSNNTIIIADSACRNDYTKAGNELFHLLKTKSPVVKKILYQQSNKSKYYVDYNESLVGTLEWDVQALVCMKKELAIIAPCWDGNDEGKMLIKLTRRNRRNNSYTALIYDLLTKDIYETAVKDVFDQFNYEIDLPPHIDIKSLIDVRSIIVT
jgi:hypothetical protein